MSLAAPHTQPAQTSSVLNERPRRPNRRWRARVKVIGVFGPIALSAAVLAMVVVPRIATPEQASALMARDTPTLAAAAVVADRKDERASGLSAPEQTDAPAIYELTDGGSRCSFTRVDSVPAVRPPNQIYGSSPDMAEVYAQLCRGAPR